MNIPNADIERIVKAVVQSMERQAPQPEPTLHAEKLPSGVFASLDDAVTEAAKAHRQLGTVAMRNLAVGAIRRVGEHI